MQPSFARLNDFLAKSNKISPTRQMDWELGKKADDSSTYDIVVTDPPYGFNT